MIEFKCPLCGGTLTVSTTKARPNTIAQLKTLFPKDLEALVTFEDVHGYLLVRPRQYLGSDTFAKIAAIIRDAGGEYISQGKESHFRVPKR